MTTKQAEPSVGLDTRTSFQFAEDARRREKGLPPIIRPGQGGVSQNLPTSPVVQPVDRAVPVETANPINITKATATTTPQEPQPAPPKLDPIIKQRLRRAGKLKGRHLSIFRCLAEDLTAAEIAQRLNLTETTVKTTLSGIYETLGFKASRGKKGVKHQETKDIAKLFVRK